LILCVLLARQTKAQALTPVPVSIQPPDAEVAVGQTIDIAVEAREVRALFAMDIELGFDPTVVQVVDVDPELDGVQVALGLFMDPGFVLVNKVDNTLGNVHLAMTQLNPSQPKSGGGPLIVLKFRGVKTGANTPLTLASAVLSQDDGTVLPVTLTSGQLQVVAVPAPGPTNTPIPTQGVGTPLPSSTPGLPAAVRATRLPVMRPTTQPAFTLTPNALTASSTPSPISTSSPADAPSQTSAPAQIMASPASIAGPTAPAPPNISLTLAAVVTATPAAFALNTPAATPANSQAAVVVTEPAATATANGSPALNLALVAGALGLLGGIIVLAATRRQPK
jgi:hypothetical protein